MLSHLLVEFLINILEEVLGSLRSSLGECVGIGTTDPWFLKVSPFLGSPYCFGHFFFFQFLLWIADLFPILQR